jgi:hypothetical protein
MLVVFASLIVMSGELLDRIRDVCEEGPWRLEWRFLSSCLCKVEGEHPLVWIRKGDWGELFSPRPRSAVEVSWVEEMKPKRLGVLYPPLQKDCV